MGILRILGLWGKIETCISSMILSKPNSRNQRRITTLQQVYIPLLFLSPKPDKMRKKIIIFH